MLLSKDQILKAPIPTLEVEVEEWGGTVKVRALSARTRMELMDIIFLNQEAVEAYEADNSLPKVEAYDQTILGILFAIVDGDNKPLFDISDYDRFRDLNYPTIAHIWLKAQSLENRSSVEAKKKRSA